MYIYVFLTLSLLILPLMGVQAVPELLDDPEALQKVETIAQERFERFIEKVSEKKPDTEDKIEILKKISAGDDEALHSAYLLYYNIESDLIGYPHLKLVVNGKVYEIHRIPGRDGSFLRERELARGLMDARRGYLPSGIVSFPISDDQAKEVVRFLKHEGGSSMKYAFFNKLFAKETYNCGGILYEALRNAGIDLPPMTRFNSMLPGQLFRRAYQNIPEAKLVGIGKVWREEFVKPNWSLKSIPMPVGFNRSCSLFKSLERLFSL